MPGLEQSITAREYIDARVGQNEHRIARMDASIQYMGEKLGACMTEERWDRHYRDLLRRLTDLEKVALSIDRWEAGHSEVVSRVTTLEKAAVTPAKWDALLGRVVALETVDANEQAVEQWRSRSRTLALTLAGVVAAFATFIVYVIIAFIK